MFLTFIFLSRRLDGLVIFIKAGFGNSCDPDAEYFFKYLGKGCFMEGALEIVFDNLDRSPAVEEIVRQKVKSSNGFMTA